MKNVGTDKVPFPDKTLQRYWTQLDLQKESSTIKGWELWTF